MMPFSFLENSGSGCNHQEVERIYWYSATKFDLYPTAIFEQ